MKCELLEGHHSPVLSKVTLSSRISAETLCDIGVDTVSLWAIMELYNNPLTSQGKVKYEAGKKLQISFAYYPSLSTISGYTLASIHNRQIRKYESNQTPRGWKGGSFNGRTG